jgi:hypothetical protein
MDDVNWHYPGIFLMAMVQEAGFLMAVVVTVQNVCNVPGAVLDKKIVGQKTKRPGKWC